jgi:hypothetical protein
LLRFDPLPVKYGNVHYDDKTLFRVEGWGNGKLLLGIYAEPDDAPSIEVVCKQPARESQRGTPMVNPYSYFGFVHVRAPSRAERAQCRLDAMRGFRAVGCPNAMFDGIYILDPDSEEGNGWPHCSTEQGKHLYYNTAGRWYISSAFTPDKNNCKAYYTTWGGVPLGTHQWDYHDGTKWTKALLTIVKNGARCTIGSCGIGVILLER